MQIGLPEQEAVLCDVIVLETFGGFLGKIPLDTSPGFFRFSAYVIKKIEINSFTHNTPAVNQVRRKSPAPRPSFRKNEAFIII